MSQLSERLYQIFREPKFLAMQGLANEVPIFIQSYDPQLEDATRQLVENLVARLQSEGVSVKWLDFFDLALAELGEAGILEDLIQEETSYEKAELLETLQNYSDPSSRLVPRLVASINDGPGETQLTLLTGAGRVFPFLRTHTILEALQPQMSKMPRHPIVIFFPGDYVQEAAGGSQLRLFGTLPTPGIQNAYYRAINIEHVHL